MVHFDMNQSMYGQKKKTEREIGKHKREYAAVCEEEREGGRLAS